MDNISNNNTKTETVDKATTSNNSFVVKAPLFLIFAEYLGAVSKALDWAEMWCKGNKPLKFQKEFIEMDAIRIFNNLEKEYSKENIVNWFNEFHDVLLADYEKKLNELETK